MQPDGKPLIEHLCAYERNTGITPDELIIEPLPLPLLWLWQAFDALSAARANNGFGLLPLAWSEIDAWARLHGLHFTRWELGTLHAADAALLRVIGEHSRKSRPTTK